MLYCWYSLISRDEIDLSASFAGATVPGKEDCFALRTPPRVQSESQQDYLLKETFACGSRCMAKLATLADDLIHR
ncbi:MAG: hypothetical protein JWQ42_4945 [Edaphobacter sp.]|jgi:hypothetical protein|nr:hypothetical protein [Edaphobacter sp.]